MQKERTIRAVVAAWLILAWCGIASAAMDLRNATVERLDNGLSVLLLEDRNFPVVSVQMLYRVGARNESYGQTGIAHFLEHMAFRGSANFPGTGLVSSVYAVGGEWHGYTWTDETTYFATLPREHLDLQLRIEADRMTRLEISPDDMEAERGAVLAEMHMYENYATSMLIDAVMYASFIAHPYRNNTIGWESDIENLTHAEVVAFYEQHYQPANAVLAIVGDIDNDEVSARVRELFGNIERKPATPLPRTAEPQQNGERRVRLHGNTDVKRFMIAYRAPSANHADFPAFLVLQELLGASSGVNFGQNDWGTPIDGGSVLEGVADDVTTWYPPSAEDYIFIIGGTIATDAEEPALELAIEQRLSRARNEEPGSDVLAAAIADVHDQLTYDVETTEDAAHQLAFFDGLGALDTLLELPQRVAMVTAADVRRVARTWLLPERRSIGWHVPGSEIAEEPAETLPPTHTAKGPLPAPPDAEPVPLPVLRTLPGGIAVIVQPSDISSSGYLQVVLPGTGFDGVTANDPVLGVSSLSTQFRPDELQAAIQEAQEIIEETTAEAGGAIGGKRELSVDPEARLEQTFVDAMNSGAKATQAPASPVLIVASGDFDPDAAVHALEQRFGGIDAADRDVTPREHPDRKDIDVHLGVSVSQAQLGYIAPAPGPTDRDSLAWQILLYILSHGYEGRLGEEAISNRGLAYYIDSRYRSDGRNGWVTLAVGVDPGKLVPLKKLMHEELQRLRLDPPTLEEVEEAKRHFVGRARSAAQSNAELSSKLAREWLWYGETLTPEAIDRRLDDVSPEDVRNAVSSFIDGVTITVER